MAGAMFNRLSWSDLKSWSDLTGNEPSPQEWDLIRAIEEIYVEHQNKKMEARARKK